MKLCSSRLHCLPVLLWIIQLAVCFEATNPISEGLRIVCYYNAVDSWRKREGKGIFLPSNIDTQKCTHLHYQSATLDAETLLIEPRDEWAEIDNRLYKHTIKLREENPKLRILLSFSPDSALFSKVIAERGSRKTFLVDAIRFLQLHDFDGLDIAWTPVCWDGVCHNAQHGQPRDKTNFATLLKELRAAFDIIEPRLMLTATLPRDNEVLEKAYDVSSLRLLDYVNAMTFDYWNPSKGTTGLHSPLYGYPGSEGDVNDTMSHAVKFGIEKEKLILGIATFGRTYTLKSDRRLNIGARTVGPGETGELTKSEGTLAYFEICERIESKLWTKHITRKGAATAFHDHQWASFEDVHSVHEKTRYAVVNGYGGVAIWGIDEDDFAGICSEEKFPLLTAANHVINGGQSHKRIDISDNDVILDK